MEKNKTAYVIGLIAAAMMIVCAQIYQQFRIDASAEDIKAIAIAERQKTLSENIAKNAILAQNASNIEDFNVAKRELDSKLKLWLLHHKALQMGEAKVLENPPKSPEITQGLADLQPYLDAIREAAENILKAEYGFNQESLKLYVENILKNQIDYYNKMNVQVGAYEKYVQDKQSSISTILLVVGLGVLALVLAILFAILLPAFSRLDQMSEDLEKINKKLKNVDEQLQNSLSEQAKLNELTLLKDKSIEEQKSKLDASQEQIHRLTADLEAANRKAIIAQRELQKTLITQNKANQEVLEMQELLAKRTREMEQSEREMRALAEAQLEANERLFILQKQEEKVKQELTVTVQKQDALNKILQKSLLTNQENLDEFLEYTVGILSEIKFLELLPGVGIFLQKENEPEVFELVKQKSISPKIQELCHNIKSGQCLCGLAIKTKETQYAHCVDERHTTRFEGIKEHGHYNIPILNQEEALGALVVYLPHGHEKQQSEIDFLEAVANIIASTVSKVRNEKELQKNIEMLSDAEKEMRALAEAQLETNEQLLLAQRKERERQQRIEKFSQILTNLAKTPLEKHGSLENAFRAITEQAAEGLGIERVSIWSYTGNSIISQDLYQKTEHLHSSGLELFDRDFPSYFKGISEGELINAPEAYTHPNTYEFLEVYLKPLNIFSLLDVPIRTGGQLWGVICCENTGDVKYWNEDEITFVRSIADITALMIEADKRRQAEEEVKRLSLVASKTDNAVIITDGAGLIEWVNDGFVKLTEYTLEEVKGKKPGDFLQGKDTNPDDVRAISIGLKRKESFSQEIYNYSKSGRGYWLSLNITPILDDEGNVVRFIAIESDITERKQAEEELKKAFEKVRKSEEDMRMLAEAQLELNEKLMIAERNLKETLEIEQKQKAELDRLVQQLKETQTQLVHNEKMASLGQLTAGIAHEINNPINFVYNGIDTLKISLDDLMEIVNKYNELDHANGNKEEIIEEVKKLKEDLEYEELTQDIAHLVADIKKGAIRTMEIVKGLRVFSRLDEEERKMANIKDCLEATLILLNNKMKGRIELKTYYDETMPEILCYPGQLNQVFMNIINNAIQAIPEERKDGKITIYTENQQEHVIIRIKDNGIGMSEQVKKRIFEPFFTTKQVGVGTGLGLSITFGIIEKHGGSIFVNSEEGRGSEFVIQLPKEKI